MIRPLALLLSLTLLSDLSGPWTLTKDKDQIATYIGKPDENGLKPTRSVMKIAGSPDMVLERLQDIASYPSWIPYCERTEVLDRPNDSTFYYYQFMDMPLVKNRDLIVKVTTTRTPAGYSINMQVAPEHIPLNDDAVRISIFAAEYSLVQQAGTDSTEIMLYNKVDPGGFIPTFALNWASRSQPFETFSNLKAHITSHQNRN